MSCSSTVINDKYDLALESTDYELIEYVPQNHT